MLKNFILFIAVLQASKPSDFDQKLWCNICQAISRELSLILRDHKSESYIDDAMSNLCQPNRFRVYEFPPPQMFQACQIFVMEHNDEIFESFHNRENNQQVETELCFQTTQACLDEEL